MTLDLTSVRAKFNRAAFHFDTVKAEVKEWFDKNPCRYVTSVNADHTRHGLIAKFDTGMPDFTSWTLTVSDGLNNLRSSLDHLVYAIAIHEANGQDPPPNEGGLGFPIVDTPDKFASKDCARRIKTLSDPVRHAIKAVQPFNRRHPLLPPPLLILNQLANADKHRLIRLSFAAVQCGDVGFAGVMDSKVANGHLQIWDGEIRDGTELFAFVFDSPNPKMQFDRVEIDFVLAMRHGYRDTSHKPFGGDRSDFSALLRIITEEVSNTIETVVLAVK